RALLTVPTELRGLKRLAIDLVLVTGVPQRLQQRRIELAPIARDALVLVKLRVLLENDQSLRTVVLRPFARGRESVGDALGRLLVLRHEVLGREPHRAVEQLA